jgi:hypothetical protein
MTTPASFISSNDEGVARLERMGFRRAGCWNCQEGRLAHDIETEIAAASNVLYAFVVDRRVM